MHCGHLVFDSVKTCEEQALFEADARRDSPGDVLLDPKHAELGCVKEWTDSHNGAKPNLTELAYAGHKSLLSFASRQRSKCAACSNTKV